MRVTVTGTLKNRPVTVTWQDGQVSGDATLAAAYRKAVDRGLLEGVEIATPAGVPYRAGPTQWQAALLIVRAFLGDDATLTVEDDQPAA